MKIDMVGPLLIPPCKIASDPCEPLHAVANSSLAQVNDSATPTQHASLREIRGQSEQTEASPDAYWLMVLKDLQRGKKREKARTVRLANCVVLRTSVISSVAISGRAAAKGLEPPRATRSRPKQGVLFSSKKIISTCVIACRANSTGDNSVATPSQVENSGKK